MGKDVTLVKTLLSRPDSDITETVNDSTQMTDAPSGNVSGGEEGGMKTDTTNISKYAIN